jgi:hypothetical protein
MQQMECNQHTGLLGKIVRESVAQNQPNPEGGGRMERTATSGLPDRSEIRSGYALQSIQ